MADGNARGSSVPPADDPSSRRRKGRPRIQAEQEGYVDRRRAQIRVAQQAYRSRNQAKLQSLSSRVQELETIVERMNASFLSLTDELIKRDILALYPDLGERVHQTIRETLFFANRGVSARDGGSDTPTADTCPNPGTHVPFQNVPHPLSLSPSSAGALKRDEQTFAHRLYRACVEKGYRCLADPSTKPETLARVFRYPLTVATRPYLVARFEAILRHGYHDSLGELDIPFISIGGAGTHYKHDQRSYINKRSAPRPGVVVLGIDQIDREMRGDWFDCYDVEGYLKSNSIVRTGGRWVVDESLLIERLSTACICLGRTPGFSRETVELFAISDLTRKESTSTFTNGMPPGRRGEKILSKRVRPHELFALNPGAALLAGIVDYL